MRLYYPIIAWADARIAAARGDVPAALGHLAQAETLAESMGMRPTALQMQTEGARLLTSTGRLEEAEMMRRKARGSIQEMAGLIQEETLRSQFVTSASHRLAE